MDTRLPIQDALDSPVNCVVFNEDNSRFVCGLGDGIRSFRTRDCIRTIKEAPRSDQGIAVAAVLDDRYVAFVGGGRDPYGSPHKLEFWDNVEAKKVHSIDLSEPILGIRMTSKAFGIVLLDRTVCFTYGTLLDSGLRAPTSVSGLYTTARNPYALCSIRVDKMALPGLTPGQVQIVSLLDKSKKIVRAHTSGLRQIDLSQDGSLLATASKQGTLFRIFSTSTLAQTHEFRRGVDAAEIYSLSISPSNSFLAATSDKGTLHIFDLRPPPAMDSTNTAATTTARKRTSISRPFSPQPYRPSSADFDNFSVASSSPRTVATATNQGGFYPPPDHLAHTPPATAPSALSALAKFPGMPRALSDARSMTSCVYALGADPPNWQGQPLWTATVLPNGQQGKVRNPNVPVPGLPDGKPPKGVVAWDMEGGERRLWVVGGGADARWEVFELLEVKGEEDGRLKIYRAGFRRYLSRQFVEEEEV